MTSTENNVQPEPAQEAAIPKKLAILVVYHLRDGTDMRLLQLHLDRIERHTADTYKVFAATNRASIDAREVLDARSDVIICDIPSTELRGSREHAYYLDALVQFALADGASHFITLDVDSFPIDDRWIGVLEATADPGSGLAAILRSENGDVDLPHPSCTFATRGFFERFNVSFSPDSDFVPEFRRFLRATRQAGDTGIRLAYVLWSAGLKWGQLHRSNAIDVHYLMAGIYDDVVFHLGAGGRDALFRRDRQTSLPHRLSEPIERFPARRAFAIRIKKRLLRMIRSRAERTLIETNNVIAELSRDWLLSDPDGLLAYLRGNAPTQDSEWIAKLRSISDVAHR